MTITHQTSVPPLPATLVFTSNWTSGALEQYRVALNLSPGSYQISVLPDLMVLTTAVGTVTENDVNQFMPEALISSAVVTRTVNWYDANGRFNPGESRIATLAQTTDSIAIATMNAAGFQPDSGSFEFYTTTFTIEPERVITYPSGARDVYTSDYYLDVWGWNITYIQATGSETALSGRVLVATGNPTGQRTTAWGDGWLNVQSYFESYVPPSSSPTLAQVANIPAAAAWSASADGSTCASPSFNYDPTTQAWSAVDMPASPSASDLAMLQGTDRASYLAALSQTMAWAEIGSRYGGAPDIVQSVYGSASTAATLYGVETTYSNRLFSAMMDAPAAAAFGTNYATVQDNLDLANQELRANTMQAAIDAIVDAASRNTFVEFIVNLWRSAKLIRHQSTESYTLTTSTAAYAGGDHRDTMIGSAFADEFSGGAGDDMAFAWDGNDRLQGGAGNDCFDGGSGVDTAVFSGARSRYTTANAQGVYTVSDGQQTEGADTLVRIERLQFSDSKLALDMGTDASGGRTALLIGAVLGRSLAFANDSIKQTVLGNALALFDDPQYNMQILAGALMRLNHDDLDIWTALSGGNDLTHIARHVLTTVNGQAPDQSALAAAVAQLQSEESSIATQGGWLASQALGTANQLQIELTGLAQAGMIYL